MSIVLYLRRVTAPEMTTMLADLDRLDDTYFDVADDADLIDFDVEWHALHYILTGSDRATDDPLSLLIDGTPATADRGIGNIEYWAIPPERMASFADALDGLTDETLASRYDLAEMSAANVYGADFLGEDDEGDEPSTNAVLRYLSVLRRFATGCRDGGHGAIKCIS